jgi:hypothetical protein
MAGAGRWVVRCRAPARTSLRVVAGADVGFVGRPATKDTVLLDEIVKYQPHR